MRISGSLTALWLVWENEGTDEKAAEMARREGEAILAFVHDGLGRSEDFSRLLEATCRLRRPGSRDGPGGGHCLVPAENLSAS